MPSLTLNLDALQVQSFSTQAESPAGEPAPEAMATANTCYRSCHVTLCFC